MAGLWLGGLCADARAQAIDPQNRPVKEILVTGLEQTPEQLVRNSIRLVPGDPYDRAVVERDIVHINALNRFSSVTVQIKDNPDNSITVTYEVTEMPLISDVQVLGNKAIPDQELLTSRHTI